MSETTFTTLCTTRTPIEAEVVMATLRSAGLHPLGLKITGHFSFAGAEIEYPIRVPSVEAAKAKELLESFEQEGMNR